MNLRFYRAPLLAALTLLTSACREESVEPFVYLIEGSGIPVYK